MTRCTPALVVFWCITEMCEAGLLGKVGSLGLLVGLMGSTGSPKCWMTSRARSSASLVPTSSGHVEPIEYRPGDLKWHAHVKHARAVIELMELDVLSSKPSPTPGSECYLGFFFDSAGRHLRRAENGLEDEDTKADRSDHALDRPDFHFSSRNPM